MLRRLNAIVSECLLRAEECEQLAKAAQDPAVAAQYLELKRGWLVLARSFQIEERVGTFIDSQKSAHQPSREPPLKAKRLAAEIVGALSSGGIAATVVHPEALSDFVRHQAEQVMKIAQSCHFPDVRAKLEEMARGVLIDLGRMRWCNGCGATMQLVDGVSMDSGQHGLRTFRCGRCGAVETSQSSGGLN